MGNVQSIERNCSSSLTPNHGHNRYDIDIMYSSRGTILKSPQSLPQQGGEGIHGGYESRAITRKGGSGGYGQFVYHVS